jgi:hypothetical protein
VPKSYINSIKNTKPIKTDISEERKQTIQRNKRMTQRHPHLDVLREDSQRLKELFLKEFARCFGNTKTACMRLNITRRIVHTWLRQDEEFEREYNDILEDCIDFVEAKMFEKINEGNVDIIKFFLLTRAKHRGYTTRLVVEDDTKKDVASLSEFAEKIRNAVTADVRILEDK